MPRGAKKVPKRKCQWIMSLRWLQDRDKFLRWTLNQWHHREWGAWEEDRCCNGWWWCSRMMVVGIDDWKINLVNVRLPKGVDISLRRDYISLYSETEDPSATIKHVTGVGKVMHGFTEFRFLGFGKCHCWLREGVERRLNKDFFHFPLIFGRLLMIFQCAEEHFVNHQKLGGKWSRQSSLVQIVFNPFLGSDSSDSITITKYIHIHFSSNFKNSSFLKTIFIS